MLPQKLIALLLASSALACGVLAGCAAPTAEEEEEPFIEGSGDGDGADEIVSERQLMGNELPDKTISLTFDDGPGPRTAELADYLAAEGVPATFFINGKNVPGRQATIDKIIGRGHLLANHTQNHLQLTRLAADKVVKEVADTDVTIARAQPNQPFVIRAPFGAWNGNTARAINATPMKKYVGSVFWDVGAVSSTCRRSTRRSAGSSSCTTCTARRST
jgi:peptidoglycan/xylan/chitin deacetylase (PgdA/CDA1 family)